MRSQNYQIGFVMLSQFCNPAPGVTKFNVNLGFDAFEKSAFFDLTLYFKSGVFFASKGDCRCNIVIHNIDDM